MKERKEAEIFREKEWYRERIVEMVGRIADGWILKEIYRTIKNITK